MQASSEHHSVLVLISGRGGGDTPPVLALASGLHARGHQVRVVCDTPTQPLVEAAGLTAVSLPSALEQGPYFAAHARHLGVIDGTPRMVYPLDAWARACLPVLEGMISTSRPSVIVASLFCSPLADALATAHGLPWVFVNPAYYFGDDSPRAWEDDFAEPSRSAFRDDFQPLMRRASLVLHATDRVFDCPPTPLPPRHAYVGPLQWELPQPTPDLVTVPGDPWVLISLSLVPQLGDIEVAQTAIVTLRDDPVRVLVTLSPTHDRAQFGDLPGNVTVTGYVPHSQVLPRCQLVVSHAGHGIVMKALWHGVPLVLVPLGRDQPGVAARAAAAGVAEVIGPEDRKFDRIAVAIRRVLDSPRYREAAGSVARRLQATDPVAHSCTLIETLADGWARARR